MSQGPELVTIGQQQAAMGAAAFESPAVVAAEVETENLSATVEEANVRAETGDTTG